MKYEHITVTTAPIQDLPSKMASFMEKRYRIGAGEINTSVAPLMRQLRHDLWAHIEYPYVDRLYRDSYYRYFASKHEHFSRDTVRVALFAGPPAANDFASESGREKLRDQYLGFFLVRPTPPNLIGRSMISPQAFRDNDYVCCLTAVTSTIEGVRLTVHAFPHSSQDVESISCAETSVWSVMEYFGNRHADYRPAVGSEIIDALAATSPQRLLPSSGLTILQISRGIRHLGFSSRLYFRDAYTQTQLERLMNVYIESGIPIIPTLTSKQIGHAVVAIGHANRIESGGAGYRKVKRRKEQLLGIDLIDTADFPRKHVLIDDNHPPYQVHNFFSMQRSYYPPGRFDNLRVSGFVVPLHERIYLEATKARTLVSDILTDPTIEWASQLIRDLIVGFSLPKFIWAELTTRDLYSNGRAIDEQGRTRAESVGTNGAVERP